MTVKGKKRGRPGTGEAKLSRETIVLGAKSLVLRENSKLSIRALARYLEIDAMAIYHYFANKSELLEAMAVSIMQDIYMPVTSIQWKRELTRLCYSYLTLLRDHPGLLETLLSLEGGDAPAAVFRERFNLAIEHLQVERQKRQDALCLLVDYLHGFALAVHCAKPSTAPEISTVDGPLALFFQTIEYSGE